MVLGHLDDGRSFPREMFATSAIYLSSWHNIAPGQGHGNLQCPDSAGAKQGMLSQGVTSPRAVRENRSRVRQGCALAERLRASKCLLLS